MKAQSAIVFLAALLPVVTADFDIYYSDNKGPAGMGKSYTFYNTGDKPSFNLVKAAHSYPKSSDLSGSDVGVRCKGSKDADGKDCTGESNPDTVQELEMRLLEGSHITLYKNRSWNLVDVKGNKAGSCKPTSENSYKYENTRSGSYYGTQMFRCTSSIIAKNINDDHTGHRTRPGGSHRPPSRSF